MIWISNAFSLSMLGERSHSLLSVRRITLAEASALAAQAQSAVGHENTAAIFSRQLGAPVAFNRTTVLLEPGDELLVGQYVGPRLAEGSTELPEGASIGWLLVALMEPAGAAVERPTPD
jgi:hypothetical protein